MKKLKTVRAAGLCLVILICATIFFFSASSGDTSEKHSGGITEVVVKVIYGDKEDYTQAEYAEIFGRSQLIVRKAAHFSIYLALGFCSFAFACTFNIKRILMLAGAFSFSVLYAASDEFHQTFVNGRCGTPTDVLIDSAGAIVGIMLSYIIIYKRIHTS